jgi:hypothetical protein
MFLSVPILRKTLLVAKPRLKKTVNTRRYLGETKTNEGIGLRQMA